MSRFGQEHLLTWWPNTHILGLRGTLWPQIDAFCGINNIKNRFRLGFAPELTPLPRPHSWWWGGLAAPLPKNPTPCLGPLDLKLPSFWPCFSMPPHFWLPSTTPVAAYTDVTKLHNNDSRCKNAKSNALHQWTQYKPVISLWHAPSCGTIQYVICSEVWSCKTHN